MMYRSQLLAGGVDSDPWGVKEEPEEFKGIQNTGLRVQQQQIIKGKYNPRSMKTGINACALSVVQG
ncbi:hypothetical protein DPMN_026083 [Dreissena polymorpha]|uniref:Uncharacterized protein n=1 Tax=Dreissena polymorpha TaxID=45954 RepID=A0A9D4LQG8_DREPO|nr:hypothetical protein DPMN_026083 [Dreissena polymorpha]